MLRYHLYVVKSIVSLSFSSGLLFFYMWVLISVDVVVQPEMEMVARSLEKHLKVEQREFLLNMLVGVCGEESQRSVAEALGLVSLGFCTSTFFSHSKFCYANI